MHADIHTYIHTYVHTHIHTYVDRHRSARWFAQSHEDVDTQRPTCRGQLLDDFCNQLLYVHCELGLCLSLKTVNSSGVLLQRADISPRAVWVLALPLLCVGLGLGAPVAVTLHAQA